MENLLTAIHILASAGVIGLVLLQHGKGADMGAAFGSGASGSLFGVSGSSNILSKLTALCVLVFFCTSLTLAYMSSHRSNSGSVIKMPSSTSTSTTGSTSTSGNKIKPLNTETNSNAVTQSSSLDNTPSNAAGGAAKDIPN